MWKTLHTYIAQLCITTLGSSSKTLVLVKLAQFWFDLRIWVVGPAFFELEVKQEGIYREFQLKGWFTSHLVWNLYEPRTCLVSNNPCHPKTRWWLAVKKYFGHIGLCILNMVEWENWSQKINVINQDSDSINDHIPGVGLDYWRSPRIRTQLMMVPQDSDSSDEEMSAFLDHHRRAMSVQRERESQMRWR